MASNLAPPADPGTDPGHRTEVTSVTPIHDATIDRVDAMWSRHCPSAGTIGNWCMRRPRFGQGEDHFPRRPASVLITAFLVLLAAACTSDPERRDLPDVEVDATTGPEPPSASESPDPTVASDVAGLAGRLAVLDETGSLVTLNPDGSGEVVLDEVEAGRSQVRQPTWSPDGSRVAWVHVEVTDDETLETVLATSTGRGTRPTEATTGVAVPFYLSWDPTSSRIAYLAGRDEDIEIGIVEGERGRATPLDTGQPYYLSWAPAGEEMLVHADEDRLERLGLDGSLTTVADRLGTFFAPVWTGDGRTFVYASADASGQHLVVHETDARRGTRLLPFDGLVRFVVSPDGRRIAFQILEEQNAQPLTVIDVRSGETTEIVEGLTGGFFWSPNGERLLYLVPDPDEERFWYRWGVWDGRSSFTTPRVLLSLLVVEQYLPFFEQYAQSMSLWSPDGSAFAYPGENEEGRLGIWVQSAEPGRAPVLVADGTFVAWSPA
jgi:TolB protein